MGHYVGVKRKGGHDMEKIWNWWRGLERWVRTLSVAAVVIFGLGSWWGLTQSQPSREMPAAPPPVTTQSATKTRGAASEQTSAATSHPTKLFVDIQGGVLHPGLYTFKPGMRVDDAIRAAGGLQPKADRRQLNLATRLADQQQVYVPLKGEKPAAAPSTSGPTPSATSGATTATINLNTATVTELQQLSGIGEKKAQKIIDYRTEHGDFKTVKDLSQVAGFGEKTVARLAERLTVN